MTEELLIRLIRRAQLGERIDAEVALTFDQRQRSRLRVRLDDGREAGILLPRGETLRDGDLLTGDHRVVVQVRAAPERLSTAASDDPLLLARACYHLGNRHVALQIEPGRLAWLHDHVLDDMVRGLGLAVMFEKVPFEPESGAYGGHAHGHGHHGHGH
jgi:urease accessory protein